MQISHRGSAHRCHRSSSNIKNNINSTWWSCNSLRNQHLVCSEWLSCVAFRISLKSTYSVSNSCHSNFAYLTNKGFWWVVFQYSPPSLKHGYDRYHEAYLAILSTIAGVNAVPAKLNCATTCLSVCADQIDHPRISMWKGVLPA